MKANKLSLSCEFYIREANYLKISSQNIYTQLEAALHENEMSS